MSIQTILNSHNSWFDLLSYTKLNELFQRASYDVIHRRKLLQVHINNELRNKINYYFVKTKSIMDNNVFAYAQGTYPYEYAPPIDHDMQFTKTILDPINRFIEVMGYNTISPNLFLINALF